MSKTASNTRQWNVRLSLKAEAGYGTMMFRRSPVLGTSNVRIKPELPVATFTEYLINGGRPLAISVGLLDEQPGDPKAEREMIDAMPADLLDDLFANYFSTLDGGAGVNDSPPSRTTGWSFKISTSLQGYIHGAGQSTGQPSSPPQLTTTNDLRAKIAALKAAQEEARKATVPTSEQKDVPAVTEQPVVPAEEKKDEATEQPTTRRGRKAS